jgi:hypothetical protein
MMTIIPYTIFGWDGSIPLKLIFIISWILLMVANSLLINTYRILYTKYAKLEQPIDLGDSKNYDIRDRLKILMICNTILLWILIIYSEYFGQRGKQQIKFPQSFIGIILVNVYKGINNQMIFLSTITIRPRISNSSMWDRKLEDVLIY